MMTFAEVLKTAALEELKWWTDGGHHECSSSKPQGSKRVERYWKEGLHINGLTGCNINQFWSAAFVCYCMQVAGMSEEEFPFSAGHHTYIRWAIRNTKQNKPNKTYYGRRFAEYKPKPGDLIAQWRTPPSTPPPSFDNQPSSFYPAHCDIVVAVSATAVEAVGGNVSNRVKTTVFAAVNGLLKPIPKEICVIECTKS